MSRKQTPIKKSDEEQHVVYGEVYAPDVPDSDGDFMDAETIRKAAHKFLVENKTSKVDKQHNGLETGAHVVESFIARKGDDTFIEGSWVVGVHIPDPEIWAQVKKGEINGFSLEAVVRGTPEVIEMEIPDVIEGGTTENEGHSHRFFVKFAEDGTFLGGVTSIADGHHHAITHGTCTAEEDGHKHNFSFVEGLI